MKEKKTKRMTKAEAFDYLKGKKVACDGSNNEAVQRKLFDVGIEWIDGSTDVISLGCTFFLFIDLYGKITHCGGSRSYFYNHDYDKISADDILSIEIIEDKKEKFENINNDLEKWIEIVRDKYCRNGWSFVISESSYALIKGDLIEEKVRGSSL